MRNKNHIAHVQVVVFSRVQMVSQKKQTIGQQCAACGHVAQVDMRHKLTTFIVKNPPEVVS